MPSGWCSRLMSSSTANAEEIKERPLFFQNNKKIIILKILYRN
jgi:hypothetical protein